MRIPGLLLLTALSLPLMLSGCGGGGSKRALDLYQRGQYAEALRQAEQSAQTSKPPESDRAALVAGMSAYELRKLSEAEKWLRPLAYSADPGVAGRASATLGLVQVARDRYSSAAIDFTSASRRLEGDEAARAHFFAGECYSILGRLDSAKSSYEQARSLARDPLLRNRISSRLTGGGSFTLQLGAFSNRVNADRSLAAGAQRASKAGLPTPTIVATPDVTGRTIYLVQVGRFGTKEEAAAARTRLGTDTVVVMAR